MSKIITVNERIKNFNKKIIVPGDKSLSIRWALFASLSEGISRARNLLMSEDVMATLDAIKKLGIKVKINKNEVEVHGQGFNRYKYKKII